MTNILRTAHISECGRYRYRLDRIWDADEPPCVFVMLNPSTADGVEDDPTIRRCVKFAREWGYGSLIVVNLYAFRATDPDKVRRTLATAVGPENNDAIREATRDAGLIVAAWGAAEWARPRASYVRKILPASTVCLGRTQFGGPRHPLYVKADARPVPFPCGVPA